MKSFVLCVLLLITGMLNAIDNKQLQGTAVFKLKPEFRSELQLTTQRTGIGSLDDRLKQLQVSGLKQRFLSPKNANHDIALIITVSSALSPQAVVNSLSTDPHVQYAEVVYPDEAFAVPNDTEYTISQYFAALEAEAAWDIHKGELGTTPVILALTDTGAKWNHVDLAPNIWNNLDEDANGNGYTLYYNGSAWVMDAGDINGVDNDGNGKVDDLIGWDFTVSEAGGESNDPYDVGGHGTAVSGIMDARTNNTIGTSSLSWNLTLMPISCSYNGQYIYTGYEGIVYAAENGADVINCSWGGTNFSQANQEVINYAYGLGSIIVAAAGNNYNEIPLYPAAYSNVLATAALKNSGVKSTISNFGAYIDFGATNGIVRTTNASGTYSTVTNNESNATSYASPVASALVGLTKSYYPSLTQSEIINRIKGSCDDIDALNPTYTQKLGEGKLNARRALADVAPAPDSEIRLYLQDNYGATETNDNLAIEPGETFSVNLRIRNYGLAAAGASLTLSTTNPSVTILSNTLVMDIPEDDYFLLTDAFSVYVLPGTVSQYVSFTITTSASLPVVLGGTLSFSLPIHAGGILVWESVLGGRILSGNYIKTRLQASGYTVAYGNFFPYTFLTYDAIFLSFGNPGRFGNSFPFNKPYMFTALQEYLEAGGKVYIEGGDAVGFDLPDNFPDTYSTLWDLLGIQSADDGAATNTINLLEGKIYAPTEGMSFTSSLQSIASSIDIFVPNSTYARNAFDESDYGCVAVVNTGSNGQRTFVFSYALAELVDGSFPSTKANLVTKIMQFFEGASFMGELSVPNVTISETIDGIFLSWEAVDNSAFYHVYASDTPDDWSGITPIVVNDLFYACPAEVKKFYKVIAVSE